MSSIRNPARSRPLSANVKRLMKMARESPLNPNVEKIEREFTDRDLAYCDMQGNIFMAAVDRSIPMEEFAPVRSQASVVCASGDMCGYSTAISTSWSSSLTRKPGKPSSTYWMRGA